MNCSCILWFMATRDVLKVFQSALAYGSCNFENFQNIARAHKSRNARAVHATSYTYPIYNVIISFVHLYYL